MQLHLCCHVLASSFSMSTHPHPEAHTALRPHTPSSCTLLCYKHARCTTTVRPICFSLSIPLPMPTPLFYHPQPLCLRHPSFLCYEYALFATLCYEHTPHPKAHTTPLSYHAHPFRKHTRFTDAHTALPPQHPFAGILTVSLAIPAQLYYHTRAFPKVHPLPPFYPFALLPTSLCLCSRRLTTTRNPFAECSLLCHNPALFCHAPPPASEIPHHYTSTFRPFASLPKSLYRCPPCFTITPKPFAEGTPLFYEHYSCL